MNISICILAKDEAKRIAATLNSLSRQTIFSEPGSVVDVHVVANGCTDDTAAVSVSCAGLFKKHGARLHVHDIQPGGKSRAWNRMVHEFAGDATDTFVFMDADIDFVDGSVVVELLAQLTSNQQLLVCAGYALKDVSAKRRKTLIERFSLAISRQTRHADAISGQLYAARAEALREIWLPNETPGEDGFLNAMINTHGFTSEPAGRLVAGHSRPTHYYESLSPTQFLLHERRLIVGTIINRWIFEYLWSLQLTTPAGPLINEWNQRDEKWVEQIIRKRAGGHAWLIPRAIVFARFQADRRSSIMSKVAYVPLATAATLISLPAAIAANERLKSAGAAATW